jgi:3-methyladenine DNA glycosylase Tag
MGDPYYENRIAALEADNGDLLSENADLLAENAKLQAVVDAAKGLVALLEETEETDDGREFHPVTISSCRVHKTSLIAEYLKSIKEVESE